MIKKICFSMIILIAVFASALPVFADNGHSHSSTEDPGPAGITATVTIQGNLPDTTVNIQGNYPDTWINMNGTTNPAVFIGDGQYYNNFLDVAAYYGAQAGGTAASNAFQNSAANSNYSGVGTGMLPLPNITSDGRVAAIDSPTTQWVPGWQGFFCPKTNLDPMVYHGSGCGGTWGVCDGTADFWVRRQLAGLAPEFRQTQNKLDTSYVAISRLIVATQAHEDNIANTEDALRQHLLQISVLSSDLAILEKEHQALKAEVMQQKEESDRKTLILFIIFGSGMLGMAGYLAAITQHYRPRTVAGERKGLFKRLAALKLQYRPHKVASEQKGMLSRLAAMTLRNRPSNGGAGEQKGMFSRLAA